MNLKEIIQTSGDIRRFLSQTMVDVKNGETSVEKGMCIAGLAKGVNDSIQSEVNVAKIKLAMLDTGRVLFCHKA